MNRQGQRYKHFSTCKTWRQNYHFRDTGNMIVEADYWCVTVAWPWPSEKFYLPTCSKPWNEVFMAALPL